MSGAGSSGGRRPDSIAQRVRTIVARTARRRAITDAFELARDLDLGEGDRVELLMAIELAFRLDFTGAEARRIVTVGDLIAAVVRKSRPADASAGRTALLEAIEDLAVGAASTGEPIDVAAAAVALAGDHPRGGLTADEIGEAVTRAAAAAGATIVPGSGRRSA